MKSQFVPGEETEKEEKTEVDLCIYASVLFTQKNLTIPLRMTIYVYFKKHDKLNLH
jgi:hypothetical protein